MTFWVILPKLPECTRVRIEFWIITQPCAFLEGFICLLLRICQIYTLQESPFQLLNTHVPTILSTPTYLSISKAVLLLSTLKILAFLVFNLTTSFKNVWLVLAPILWSTVLAFFRPSVLIDFTIILVVVLKLILNVWLMINLRDGVSHVFIVTWLFIMVNAFLWRSTVASDNTNQTVFVLMSPLYATITILSMDHALLVFKITHLKMENVFKKNLIALNFNTFSTWLAEISRRIVQDSTNK